MPGSPRPVLRTVLIVAAAVSVVLALVLGAMTVVLIRRPLPAYGGSLAVDGLRGEVEILRDARGIPQIYADSAEDLFRAQGYVHAQDRFFEMDYRRHVTAGRLAQLVGADEEAIASDVLYRTLGVRRVAERELALLDTRTVAYLEAYAAGVNDYLAGREPSRVAVEYSVLSLSGPANLREIAPWTPVDSLAWLKGLAWDLRANFDAEAERAAVYAVVGDVPRVEELFPAYPEGNPTLLTEFSRIESAGTGAAQAGPAAADQGLGEALRADAAQAAVAAAGEALRAGAPLASSDRTAIGSGAIAVSGELTRSGGPLLANDPHLGLTAPGALYQAGLHCRSISPSCPYDVAGFGYAGIPGILFGHNTGLAWGLAALPADLSDLFLQRVYDDGTYVREGARVPLTERTETIEVNGGEDVDVVIRETEQGPLVSDVVAAVAAARSAPVAEGAPPSGLRGYSVSLGWSALTPGRTMDAILALDRAQDAAEVAEAAALLDAPAQAIVFATTAGQIGFQAAGLVPQRLTVTDSPVPSDGSWPRPGWDSRFDWVGFVARADLPAVVNPGSGYVVAANQAVLPPGEGPFLTRDWDSGYRAARLGSLLEEAVAEGAPLTAESLAAIQADELTPYAEVILPHLLRAGSTDSFVESAVDLLRDWDGRMTEESAAAAYFASVWANVLRLTFADDLPAGIEPDGGPRWLDVVRALLEQPNSVWWDDRTTINVVESRDQILGQALIDARRQLTVSLGKDPSRWEWGRVHVAAPRHTVLGGPEDLDVLQNLVNPRPLGVSGGSATVNSTAWVARDWTGSFPNFEVVSGPVTRMVIDVADWDASTWVNVTGISGHPGSRHYTDQFRAWADGRYYPWPFSEGAVREAAGDTRTLRPNR